MPRRRRLASDGGSSLDGIAAELWLRAALLRCGSCPWQFFNPLQEAGSVQSKNSLSVFSEIFRLSQGCEWSRSSRGNFCDSRKSGHPCPGRKQNSREQGIRRGMPFHFAFLAQGVGQWRGYGEKISNFKSQISDGRGFGPLAENWGIMAENGSCLPGEVRPGAGGGLKTG